MKIIHSACARPSALSSVLRLLLLREPFRLVLPDNGDRSIGIGRAARIVISSALAKGGSTESMELRAHSIRPGHILPTRINGEF